MEGLDHLFALGKLFLQPSHLGLKLCFGFGSRGKVVSYLLEFCCRVLDLRVDGFLVAVLQILGSLLNKAFQLLILAVQSVSHGLLMRGMIFGFGVELCFALCQPAVASACSF